MSRDIKTYSISYYFRIISFYFGYKSIRKRWFFIELTWLILRRFQMDANSVCISWKTVCTDYINITVIAGINRSSKSFIKNGCKISFLKSSSDLHSTRWSLNTLWTCLYYISLNVFYYLRTGWSLLNCCSSWSWWTLYSLFRYRFFLRN